MPNKLPYDVASHLIHCLYEAWEHVDFDEDYAKFIIIPISEILYCTPVVHSGFASIDAASLPVSKLTKDHYYSRARTAYRILDLMRKDILTANRMVPFLKSRSRVHYILREENMKLSTRGKQAPHWKIMYANAGIELVPYKGKQIKK